MKRLRRKFRDGFWDLLQVGGAAFVIWMWWGILTG